MGNPGTRLTRDQTDPVTWISHRGYKKFHTENTIGAFQAAVDQGFSVLETDLRVTEDQHIVLSHDASLKRLTGIDTPLHAHTRKELEEFELPNRERLLFGDEFFSTFSSLEWILGIKPGPNTLEVLYHWAIKNHFMNTLLSQARFLLWTKHQMKQARNLFPGIPIYPHRRACWRAAITMLTKIPFPKTIEPGKTYSLPPEIAPVYFYKPSVVNYYHKRHAKLLAFLPEKESDIQAAIRAGFDEILTNGIRLA